MFLFGGLRRADTPQRLPLRTAMSSCGAVHRGFATTAALPLQDGRHPLLVGTGST